MWGNGDWRVDGMMHCFLLRFLGYYAFGKPSSEWRFFFFWNHFGGHFKGGGFVNWEYVHLMLELEQPRHLSIP